MLPVLLAKDPAVTYVDGPGAPTTAHRQLSGWADDGATVLASVGLDDLVARSTVERCAWVPATRAALLFAAHLETAHYIEPCGLRLVVVGPPDALAAGLWDEVEHRVEFVEVQPGVQDAFPAAEVCTDEASALDGGHIESAMEACERGARFPALRALIQEHQRRLDLEGVGECDPRRAPHGHLEMLALSFTHDQQRMLDRGRSWMDLAERAQWPEVLVQVSLEVAMHLANGDMLDQARALRNRAAALLDPERMPGEPARLALTDAILAEKDGELAEALVHTARWIEDARVGERLRRRLSRAHIRQLRMGGDLEGALRGCRQAAGSGHNVLECDTGLEAAACLMGLGRPAEGLLEAERCARLAWSCALHHRATMAYTLMGEIKRQAGQLDEAARLYEHAQRLSADSPFLLANLGIIESIRGRHTRSIALIAESLDKADAAPALRCALGSLLLPSAAALGDSEAVARGLRDAERFERMGQADADVMHSVLRTAQTLADARAARCLRVGLSMAARLAAPEVTASCERRLATLASARCPIPLGDFDVVEPLAKGGMGEVWRAVHRPTGLPAAVKVLAQHSSESEQRSFQDEARAIAGLEHPNIIALLDYGSIDPLASALSSGRMRDGCSYLAMELVQGGTLTGALGQRPWGWCLEVLVDLLSALAHAHANGVIHRDLKPSNVLLPAISDPNRGARLADFGVSFIASSLPQDHRVSGTPLYMAPEQWMGQGATPSTDLYALGCVATAMLTGRPPFIANDVRALASAHLHQPIPRLAPLGAVPPGFGDWITRTLQKHPQDRFELAADARAALEALGPPGCAPEGTPGGASAWNTPAFGGADSTLEVSTLVATEPEPAQEPPPARQAMAVLHGPMPTRWPPDLAIDPLVRSTRLVGMRRPPLTGRTATQDELWQALVQAHQHGAAVALHGEPGIGRTRLWRELRVAAHKTGAATTLVCQRQDLDSALRAHLEVPDEPVPAYNRLRTLTADAHLAHRLAEGGEPADVLMLVAELSQRRCLIVVAVGPCPGLPEAAAEALAGEVPVLWLFVPEPGSDAALPPGTTDLALGPLERHASVRLLQRGFGMARRDAHRVAQRVSGHPLFAVRLIRQLGPSLELREGGLRLPARASLALPDDLHRACQVQLEPVLARGPEAVATLTRWALLGQEISERTLAEIAALSACLDAKGLVEDLQAHFLATRRDGGGWRLRDVLLLESLRRRAAQAGTLGPLARTVSDLEKDALRRGMLLRTAGDLAGSLEPLQDGVASLLSGGRAFQAAEVLGDIQDVLHGLAVPPTDDRWALLWRRLAHAQQYSGDFAACLQSCNRALQLLPKDPELRHRRGIALLRCGDVGASNDVHQGILDEPNGADDVLLAGVHRSLALNLLWAGQYEEALDRFQRLLTLVEVLGHPKNMGQTHTYLGITLLQLGRITQAETHLHQALAHLQSDQHVRPRTEAMRHLAQAALARGDLAAARSHLERALPLSDSERLGGIIHTVFALGEVAEAEGELAEAKHHFERAARLAEDQDQSLMAELALARLLRLSVDAEDTHWNALIRRIARVPPRPQDGAHDLQRYLEEAAQGAERAGHPLRAERVRGLIHT
jgi:eukaryotic-like serine/threonine-protein kinase